MCLVTSHGGTWPIPVVFSYVPALTGAWLCRVPRSHPPSKADLIFLQPQLRPKRVKPGILVSVGNAGKKAKTEHIHYSTLRLVHCRLISEMCCF